MFWSTGWWSSTIRDAGYRTAVDAKDNIWSVRKKWASRKFNSQTKESTGALNYRANREWTNQIALMSLTIIQTSDFCRSSTNKEADSEASRLITQKFQSEFCDVFIGIGYFRDMLKLKVREGSCPYQGPPRRLCMHSRSQSKRNWKDCRSSK